MESIYEFYERNTIIQQLYDAVRIIEPAANKEVVFVNGEKSFLNDSCYKFWNRSKKCSNCIAMRAYLDKKTYVKVEHDKEKIFLVMALPVKIGLEEYVIELLKDITESGIIENIETKNQEEVGSAIHEMNVLVVTDELTGVYNRRFINEQLPAVILANKIDSNPITAMMVDIDRFKSINDNYGHLAGDAVLKYVSETLQKNIEGRTGWVARYGGDEFFLILEHLKNEDAFELAEKIRNQISGNMFKYNHIKIKLSVSVGIYVFEPNNLTPKEVIANVDRNLYLAKEKGRNRSQI